MTGREIDEVTGAETTGHEWDGIKELNRPLPRWWLWVLYATIVWSVGYWLLMPAWPLVASHTKGLLGYSQRQAVTLRLEEARAAQAVFRERIAEADPAAILADPELLRFALAGGGAAFGDNCAPCHGRGGQGARGYPSLSDDVWLWGGTLDDIHRTIEVGIRADHPDTRFNQMPAFGRDGILTAAQIGDVAEHVLSLTGRARDKEAAERGAQLFAENCAACHGPAGEGNQELGAPSLADQVWLYGGDKASIVQSIRNGRNGVMPAWTGRLDPETVKQLAVYVHALGGGQ